MKPPTTGNAAAGLLAASCVSTLVVNANTSAVSILLPAISADVGAPISTLQWAVTGYSLVGAAVIVTAGALGDVFGRRRVFVGGLLLFVLSCALIALARGAALVIVGRLVQGAAGSTLVASGLSLLSSGTSGPGRTRAVALWGAAAAIGAAVGPLLGGVLVGATGWQGLFWIDAVVAAACVPLTLRTVAESRDPDRPRTIDLAGTVLVAAVLAPLILALSEGGDWGWASPKTVGCLVVSVAAAVAFVAVERRVAAPLVDLALLRNRVLVGATLGILLGAGSVNALMYLFSIYAQDPAALGLDPLQAGLATLPVSAALVGVTPLVTPLTVRFGTRAVVGWGFAVTTAGFAALCFVRPGWGYGVFVVPLVAIAVGLGLSNGPCSAAATTAVRPEHIGAASGVSNMARYVGASVLTAVAASVYDATEPGPAAAFGRAALAMTLFSAVGVALAVLAGRHRPSHVDVATMAASATHTVHPHTDRS